MTQEVMDALAIYGGAGQYQVCDWVYAGGIFLATSMLFAGMIFNVAREEGATVVGEIPVSILILGFIGLIYAAVPIGLPVFICVHYLLLDVWAQVQTTIISATFNVAAFIFFYSSFLLKRMKVA